MAARTIEIDFTASDVSTQLATLGFSVSGSGGSFESGVGYYPGRAERIQNLSVSSPEDLAGDWHAEIEVSTQSVSVGAAHDSQLHQSSADEVSIASITRSGTTATATVVEHSLASGDAVFIKGATVTAWNASWTLTSTTATTLVFTCAGTESNDTSGLAKVVRNSSKVIFSAHPAAGSGTTWLQLYRHGNGNITLIEKSGGVQTSKSVYCSSVGKSSTTLLEVDEVSGVLSIRINGALIATLTRGAASTSTQFERIYIGGNSSGYFGSGYIKRFLLTNERTAKSSEIGEKVIFFGDSYVVSGGPGVFALGEVGTYGLPRCDSAFIIGIKQAVYLMTGKVYELFGHGHNGHGWSESHTSPLSDHVSGMLSNNPTVVWCHGSVNDVQSALASDYESSWHNMIDVILATASVKRLIISTVPNISCVANYDTAAVRLATKRANNIIRGLAAYNSRVWIYDEFEASGGESSLRDSVIGSAPGTSDQTDIHWTPRGHNSAAARRATVVAEALTGVRQTGDRRYVSGGAPARSSLIPSIPLVFRL